MIFPPGIEMMIGLFIDINKIIHPGRIVNRTRDVMLQKGFPLAREEGIEAQKNKANRETEAQGKFTPAK
jgi:hypothetical protein